MIINCPECKKEISDHAISCPYCGIPITSDSPDLASSINKKKGFLFLTISFMAFLLGLLTPNFLYIIPALVIIISSIISLARREKLFPISILLILATIALLSSSISGSSSNNQKEINDRVYAGSKMMVVNWAWDGEGGGHDRNDNGHIRGRVRNRGDKVVTYFKLTARFYDEKYNILNSEYTIHTEELFPDSEKDFQIMYRFSRDYKKVDFIFTELKTE